MKRNSAWLSFTACALTAASAATASTVARPVSQSAPTASAATASTVARSLPQTPKANLSSVELVNCSGGLTGFFDKASGKVYLYDSTLKNCVAVRRVTQLGAPLENAEENAE